jgi:hypothetical protein
MWWMVLLQEPLRQALVGVAVEEVCSPLAAAPYHEAVAVASFRALPSSSEADFCTLVASQSFPEKNLTGNRRFQFFA